MGKIYIVQYYTPKIVKENPDIYFVYGDNLIHKGKGGQAIIRDLPNTIGVPTKKLPSLSKEAFFNDRELEKNKRAINKAILKINKKLDQGFIIALPKDGLGTGLAKLREKAPKTNEFLHKKLRFLLMKNTVLPGNLS